MRLACLLLAALLAVAACGDEGGDTAAFCKEFESFIEQTQTADQSTPEGLEKAVHQTLGSLEKVAAALPADQAKLKKDVESLIGVYGGVVSLLEKANWDQSKVDAEEYEKLAARQSEYAETQQQLMKYGSENCDIEPGAPSTDPQAPTDSSQPPAPADSSAPGSSIAPSVGHP